MTSRRARSTLASGAVVSLSVVFLLFVGVLWLLVGDVPWRAPADDLYGEEEAVPRVALREVVSGPACTDRGRTVQLMLCTLVGSAARHAEEDLAWLRRSPLSGYVVTLPSDGLHCNCHGWVFAGGRYWVPGSEVEAILRDNGYAPVETPQPGDLAIYRNAAGEPVHSGIVRVVAQGIPVLVESKWGQRGRYLHPADVHDHDCAVCTFYRSARQGHILRGLPQGPLGVAPQA